MISIRYKTEGLISVGSTLTLRSTTDVANDWVRVFRSARTHSSQLSMHARTLLHPARARAHTHTHTHTQQFDRLQDLLERVTAAAEAKRSVRSRRVFSTSLGFFQPNSSLDATHTHTHTHINIQYVLCLQSLTSSTLFTHTHTMYIYIYYITRVKHVDQLSLDSHHSLKPDGIHTG